MCLGFDRGLGDLMGKKEKSPTGNSLTLAQQLKTGWPRRPVGYAFYILDYISFNVPQAPLGPCGFRISFWVAFLQFTMEGEQESQNTLLKISGNRWKIAESQQH